MPSGPKSSDRLNLILARNSINQFLLEGATAYLQSLGALLNSPSNRY